MKIVHILHYFVLILFLGNTAYSQNRNINFSFFSVEEGLSNRNVNDITQDEDGLLWIATENGLNKFDGYSFQIYKQNPLDSNTLMHNSIGAVLADQKNGIWIGTKGGGLQYFDKSTGTFTSYANDPSDSTSLLNNYITSLYLDNNNQLWIGQWSGFSIFSIDTKTFQNFPLHHENIKANFILSICGDTHNNIWMGTHGGGALKINKTTKQYRRYLPGSDAGSISGVFIKGIFCDSKSRVWLASWGDGVNIYQHETDKFTHLKNINGDNSSLIHNECNDILEDSRGNIWIGSEGGLSLYLEENNSFINYISDNRNETSLSRKIVINLFEDVNGTLWVATNGGGINYFSLNASTFENINIRNNQSNVIRTISEDEKYLWIGTEQGLYQYNKITNKQQRIELPVGNTGKNHYFNGVSCIKQAGDTLWIGYNGLISYHIPTGQVELYQHNEADVNSLANNDIYDINITNNQVWIASKNEFSRFDIKNKSFTHFNDSKFKYSNIADVRKIEIEKNGELVLITGYNISIFDPKTEVIQHIDSAKNLNNTFVKISKTYSLLRENDKKYWCGTKDGLYLINLSDRLIEKHYTTKEGLTKDAVLSLVKDNNGIIWAGTENGLSRIDEENQEITNYYIEDGLCHNYFSLNASFRSAEGLILLGTKNGVCRFKSEKIIPSTKQTLPILTDFWILEGSTRKSHLGELKSTISGDNTFALNYKQKVFAFEFSSIDFLHASLNKFSYKLEGFDKEWILADFGERKAMYMNIPAGHYTFKVRTSKQESNENPKALSIPIYIAPPYWNTVWFKILIILGIASMLLTIYKARIKHYKNKEGVLNKEVVSKEEIIANKEEELAIQAQNLQEINELLKERQEEIIKQNEHILQQKEALEKHQKNLENLVEERTLDLKKALKKANESDNLKTRFLENMSHELRTPMNGILGFAELLTSEDVTEEEKKEYLDIIQTSTNQLLQTVTDIVELSKLESKQASFKTQEVNIQNLLHDIYNNFLSEKIKRDKDHIQIKMNIGANISPNIMTDDIRLRQILTYLMRNALKFTKKGSITFGCNLTDHKTLEFHVQDTGIGIAPEMKEVIFERFRQLDENTSREYGGIGLGLSISQGLVKLFGGKIWVESEVNKGSVFKFTIPYRPNNSGEMYQKVITRNKGSVNWANRTILIVEDEENNFVYLQEVLKNSNANLIHAVNGKQAIDYCSTNDKIDMVLMDIKLPDISGLDATRQIRKIRKDLPIIAQTAHALQRDRDKCIDAGCNDYISKPIDKKSLLDKIGKNFKPF